MPGYTPTYWYSHPGVDREYDGNVWKCTTILRDMGICVKRSHILSTLGCSNLSRGPIEGICATVLAQSGGPQPRTQTPGPQTGPRGRRGRGPMAESTEGPLWNHLKWGNLGTLGDLIFALPKLPSGKLTSLWKINMFNRQIIHK